MQPLLIATERGVYCPDADFYIDPWQPVERAVVTHAHSDHARWGCGSYLCAEPGRELLRLRVGDGSPIETLAYGEAITIGNVRVSLHPAGHILGSSQVRCERDGEVWVVSGDYKAEYDLTSGAFEPLPCHTFITESTFGLPIFRWRPQADIFQEINAWWSANASVGITSVIYAYALGKAQRLLAGVDPAIGPILAHGAVRRFIDPYRAEGVALPRIGHADAAGARASMGRALVIAPPSADTPGWLRKFGEARTAFASGWMQMRGSRRRRCVDRGFVLSDHADWPGLLAAIDATGAASIGITHGYTAELARYLSDKGKDAWILPTRYENNIDSADAEDE